MLKIEFKGNVYDWFDVNATKVIWEDDFPSILQQNIKQYYSVPVEHQLISDSGGDYMNLVAPGA